MNKKKIVIHQPDFSPHLNFFWKIKISNKFVILDDVQFIRRGWHHRDKIKSIKGPVWLTCSIKKGDFFQNINEVELSDNNNWKKNHLSLLKENYKSTKNFNEIYKKIENIYSKNINKLIDFNLEFIKLGMNYLRINTDFIFSSSYNLNSKKSQKIIEILKKENATHYVTGYGSKNYLEEKLFKINNIKIEWVKNNEFIYDQLYDTFVNDLSFLDLLFNHGSDSYKYFNK